MWPTSVVKKTCLHYTPTLWYGTTAIYSDGIVGEYMGSMIKDDQMEWKQVNYTHPNQEIIRIVRKSQWLENFMTDDLLQDENATMDKRDRHTVETQLSNCLRQQCHSMKHFMVQHHENKFGHIDIQL